jgi:hypothetical protein
MGLWSGNNSPEGSQQFSVNKPAVELDEAMVADGVIGVGKV